MEIKANAEIRPLPEEIKKLQEQYMKDPEGFNKKYENKNTKKPSKKFDSKNKKKVSWHINFDTVMKGDRQISDRSKDDGTRVSLNMNPSNAEIDENGKVKKDSKLKYDTIIKNNSGEATWMGVQNHPEGSGGMVSGLVVYGKGQDITINFNLDGIKSRHAETINAKLKAAYENLLKENEGNVNVPVFTQKLNELRKKEISAVNNKGKYDSKLNGSVLLDLAPASNHSQTLISQPYQPITDNTMMYGNIVIPAKDDQLKEVNRKNTTKGTNVQVSHGTSSTQMAEFKTQIKQFESQRQAFIDEVVDVVSSGFKAALGKSTNTNLGIGAGYQHKSGGENTIEDGKEVTKGDETMTYDTKNKKKYNNNSKQYRGDIKSPPRKDGGSGGGGFMGKVLNRLGPLGKGLNFVLNLKNMLNRMEISGGGTFTYNGGEDTETKTGTDKKNIDITKTTDKTIDKTSHENAFNLSGNFSLGSTSNFSIEKNMQHALTQRFRSELSREISREMSQYLMQRFSKTETTNVSIGGKKETLTQGGYEYQHTVREKGKPYLDITGRKTF